MTGYLMYRVIWMEYPEHNARVRAPDEDHPIPQSRYCPDCGGDLKPEQFMARRRCSKCGQRYDPGERGWYY